MWDWLFSILVAAVAVVVVRNSISERNNARMLVSLLMGLFAGVLVFNFLLILKGSEAPVKRGVDAVQNGGVGKPLDVPGK